ncbi:MAG: Arp2/3 complex subunit, actin nucleation center [Cirrosporium novae-zelandiae]|nr:MAG: Arp2/3 complex subunit, actin nucleation center [Cirrosporium novae-zelandiae]
MGSSYNHEYKPLKGKVALITGSARGIGKGIATELAKQGADIVINYANSSSAAEKTVAELKEFGVDAIAIKANVTKLAEVKQLFEDAVKHYGKLDVVCSNSGTELFKPEEEVTEEDFDRVFGLNTKAQFFVGQQAYKHLPKNGGGRLVLTSSIAASATGIPNHALYAGSKAAIGGFVRSFAKDFGHHGITCNAIAPGGVKTDMFAANAWHYAPGGYKDMPLENIEKGIASACPLGRCAVPQDIARVVAFLAGPDSEWINAQVIPVDGGGV